MTRIRIRLANADTLEKQLVPLLTGGTMFIPSEKFLPLGSPVEVDLFLLASPEPLKLTGRVRTIVDNELARAGKATGMELALAADSVPSRLRLVELCAQYRIAVKPPEPIAAPRSTPKIAIRLPDDETLVTQFLSEVASGELFLRCDKFLPLGAKVHLELFLPSERETLLLLGVVTKVYDSEGARARKSTGMGLVVAKPEDPTRQRLKALYARYRVPVKNGPQFSMAPPVEEVGPGVAAPSSPEPPEPPPNAAEPPPPAFVAAASSAALEPVVPPAPRAAMPEAGSMHGLTDHTEVSLIVDLPTVAPVIAPLVPVGAANGPAPEDAEEPLDLSDLQVIPPPEPEATPEPQVPAPPPPAGPSAVAPSVPITRFARATSGPLTGPPSLPGASAPPPSPTQPPAHVQFGGAAASKLPLLPPREAQPEPPPPPEAAAAKPEAAQPVKPPEQVVSAPAAVSPAKKKSALPKVVGGMVVAAVAAMAYFVFVEPPADQKPPEPVAVALAQPQPPEPMPPEPVAVAQPQPPEPEPPEPVAVVQPKPPEPVAVVQPKPPEPKPPEPVAVVQPQPPEPKPPEPVAVVQPQPPEPKPPEPKPAAPKPVAPGALRDDAGTLNFTADLAATVFVNGKKVGKAPVSGIKANPGKVQVRFDCVIEDQLVKGKTKTLVLAASGTLDVNHSCYE